MTKKFIFDLLLGLIFLSLLGLYINQHYIIAYRKRISPALKITTAEEIFEKKTIVPSLILNTAVTSSACTLFLKNSSESSMKQYVFLFIDHQVDAIIKTCEGALPDTLQKQLALALSVCKSSTRENISKDCYSALRTAKSSGAATILREDADLNELSPPLLLHLLNHRLATNDFLDHPEKSLSLIEALLTKEPNYLNGYKLKLFLLASSSLKLEASHKELFQETLSAAIKLNPRDPKLRTLTESAKFPKDLGMNLGDL